MQRDDKLSVQHGSNSLRQAVTLGFGSGATPEGADGFPTLAVAASCAVLPQGVASLYCSLRALPLVRGLSHRSGSPPSTEVA